jgi:hypothetical protein
VIINSDSYCTNVKYLNLNMENYIQNEGVIVDTPQTDIISDNSSFKSTENKLSFTPNFNRVSSDVRDQINLFLEKTPLKNTYKKDGVLYLITIVEKTNLAISFKSIKKHFGKNNNYNPDAEYQRRGEQHTDPTRRDILISILSGENVGLIVLKQNQDMTWDIVDGKQRMEVVYDFLNNKLEITSDKAGDFWKLFLNNRFLYKEHISDKQDLLSTNKILDKIKNGKFPKVKFEALPSYIQEHIIDEFQLNGIVAEVQVKNLNTNVLVYENEEIYNKKEVGKSILKKFIDINKNKKVISSSDILWASNKDCILEHREFLSTLPRMGNAFNYVLKIKEGSNDLDDTNEIRKFMILLARASMIYQGDLSWGDSEKKLVSLVLEKDNGDFSTKTREIFEKMISCFEKGLFSQTYFHANSEKELKIQQEFTSSRSDILKLSYFTMMWYLTKHIEMNPNEYMKAGEGKIKLFKLVEKISEYLTLGKLANINYTEWNRDDLPLMKYSLGKEFYSEEYFEDIKITDLLHKVKDLNQHQAGLSKDYSNTFTKLIRYAESKLN